MAIDTDGAPKITIGGKEWPVPLLAAKQNRIIDPLILSLLPIFSKWQADKTAALAMIGSKEYDALIEIAFQAIRRAHPDLKREDFMELPINLTELIAAFSTIAQQTGIFQRGPAGEAPGASSPLTGTESSPISAT